MPRIQIYVLFGGLYNTSTPKQVSPVIYEPARRAVAPNLMHTTLDAHGRRWNVVDNTSDDRRAVTKKSS